jgi:F1F0 ATPase subunit 2
MIEPLPLVRAGMFGVLLGALFFGGLWLAVHAAVSSKQPAPWFLGGFLLRAGVTLAGFYVVSRGHWERLPACLLGFALVHVFVTMRTRAQMRRAPAHPAQEAR